MLVIYLLVSQISRCTVFEPLYGPLPALDGLIYGSDSAAGTVLISVESAALTTNGEL